MDDRTAGRAVGVEVVDERTRHIRSLTGAATGATRYGAAEGADAWTRRPGAGRAGPGGAAAGAGVVVLEAMKMENELKASADARVKTVRVKAGRGGGEGPGAGGVRVAMAARSARDRLEILERLLTVRSSATGATCWCTSRLPITASDRSYPVLYMHDGQNLFDPSTSFAGDWGVGSAMDSAARRGIEAIVVGVPNMGAERLNEYSPFRGSGRGRRRQGRGLCRLPGPDAQAARRPAVPDPARARSDGQSPAPPWAGSSACTLFSAIPIPSARPGC